MKYGCITTILLILETAVTRNGTITLNPTTQSNP
jgi:hypothetical protein